MGMDVEIIVDAGMCGKEPLGRALRLELLLLSLASPNRKMRGFGSVVGAHAARPMTFGQSEFARCSAIRCEPIDDDRLGVKASALEQLAQQLQRSALVPAFLEQNVEHLAFVVDGSLKPHTLAANFDHHLVQVPATRWFGSAASQIPSVELAELARPASDRLVADLDPTLGEQLLNIA